MRIDFKKRLTRGEKRALPAMLWGNEISSLTVVRTTASFKSTRPAIVIAQLLANHGFKGFTVTEG